MVGHREIIMYSGKTANTAPGIEACVCQISVIGAEGSADSFCQFPL